MNRQRREDVAHVVRGHSLRWDADTELFVCDACERPYFSVGGGSPDDWCVT